MTWELLILVSLHEKKLSLFLNEPQQLSVNFIKHVLLQKVRPLYKLKDKYNGLDFGYRVSLRQSLSTYG